eukprot:gene16075-biopygen4495
MPRGGYSRPESSCNRSGLPIPRDRHIIRISRGIGMMLGKQTEGTSQDLPAGGILSLRPITFPVLCPRFGQVRVFHMRTRDVPGHSRMVLSGLVPCSVARARQLRFQLGSGREHPPRDMSSGSSILGVFILGCRVSSSFKLRNSNKRLTEFKDFRRASAAVTEAKSTVHRRNGGRFLAFCSADPDCQTTNSVCQRRTADTQLSLMTSILCSLRIIRIAVHSEGGGYQHPLEMWRGDARW